MKQKNEKNIDERPEKDEKKTKDSEENGDAEEETDEGSKANSDCDHDNDVSSLEAKDEEFDRIEIEEEDWIEYIKRSTKEAEEQMRKTKIPVG